MPDAHDHLIFVILAVPESTASTLYGMYEILESTGELEMVTHLDLRCEAGGLCTPDDGSYISIPEIGRVDVIGAWRPEPVGGFLTLIGLQTMTLDFNAEGDCVPYTFDGIAEGCL